MAESRPPSGGSRGGRARGTANKDKAELRMMVQDAVEEWSHLRRDQIRARFIEENGREPTEQEIDELQPYFAEWDPVVNLAIIAADHRNKVEIRRQASADAAQYLRPKLKSIELLEDPESLELQREKSELASKMVSILVAMEEAKRT